MTSAQTMYQKISDHLGRPFSSCEAYGNALTKLGVWQRNKRGRGAIPRSRMDGGKLALAFLANGPNELGGSAGAVQSFFLDYANMTILPNQADEPWVCAVRDVLNLPDDAKFLDFLTAILSLFIEEEVERLGFSSGMPDGFYGDDVGFHGPSVEVRIKGPFPAGSIRFLLSDEIKQKLRDQGIDMGPLLGMREINFGLSFIKLMADANRAGDTVAAEGYGNVIRATIEKVGNHIGFERFFGSNFLDALASAFREEDGESADEPDSS